MATEKLTSGAANGREALATYARGELRGDAVYRGYRPKTTLIEDAASRLPKAHLVVVSAPWCPDCRREVPKIARIVELLPVGWTVELRGDDAVTRDELDVRAIPTFIVQDEPGGREIGRIIESPQSSEGLEGDLLAIAGTADDDEAAA